MDMNARFLSCNALETDILLLQFPEIPGPLNRKVCNRKSPEDKQGIVSPSRNSRTKDKKSPIFKKSKSGLK